MIRHEIYEDPKMGRVVRLLEPMTFLLGSRSVFIPAGATSDGMSAPRWSWWLIDPVHDERTLEPAIRHDALYETHVVSRSYADRYFRDDLVRHRFPLILAYVIWICVRLWGWTHW